MRFVVKTDSYLSALKFGNVFTLLVIHQEGNLLVQVLALLHRDHLTHGLLRGSMKTHVKKIVSPRHLVFLQLEMADNVGHLLAFLIRKLSLNLDWNLAATLGDYSAAAGGRGDLLKMVTCSMSLGKKQ